MASLASTSVFVHSLRPSAAHRASASVAVDTFMHRSYLGPLPGQSHGGKPQSHATVSGWQQLERTPGLAVVPQQRTPAIA